MWLLKNSGRKQYIMNLSQGPVLSHHETKCIFCCQFNSEVLGDPLCHQVVSLPQVGDEP